MDNFFFKKKSNFVLIFEAWIQWSKSRPWICGRWRRASPRRQRSGRKRSPRRPAGDRRNSYPKRPRSPKRSPPRLPRGLTLSAQRLFAPLTRSRPSPLTCPFRQFPLRLLRNPTRQLPSNSSRSLRSLGSPRS